ncbi:MAG: hypothetical protein ACLQBL_21350 [Polyangiaceae bacterium]
MFSFHRVALGALLLGSSACSTALETSGPASPVSVDATTAASSPAACVVTGPARIVATRARVSGGGDFAALQSAIAAGHDTGSPPRLASDWTLPGTGAIDGLRAVEIDGTSIVTFRRASSVWIGAVSPDGTARGPLVEVSARASANPAIGRAETGAIVSWQEGEAIRWARWTPGSPALAGVRSLRSTDGVSTIWPSLATMADGRELLAWTEVSGDKHDIRALVIDRDGAPLGSRMTIAADGADHLDVLGHANANVDAQGRGEVAFIVQGRDRFGVAATPIACDGTADAAVAHLSERE